MTTFGSLTVTVGEARIPAPATQKARAILAYCVLNRRSGIARERLLELFWPDIDPERSRASLSTALHSIRRGFREASLDSEQFFETNKSVVRWTAEIAVDVEEFRAFADSHAATDWEAALRLAEGEFLEGDYDEWTVSLREELNEEREAVLTQAVSTSADVSLARELIARNPYSEEGYTALISGHIAAGRSHAAAEVAGRYLEALREIDAKPSDEFAAQYGPLLHAPPPAAANDALPLPFVGREAELRILRAHVEKLARGEGSIVVLAGEPGIGKSALVTQLLSSTAIARWHIACAENDPRVFGPWETVFTELIGEPIEAALGAGGSAPSTSLAERVDLALAATPHVVVVDDVQYLQAEALELLLHVVKRAAARHAFVLVMRPEGEASIESLFAIGVEEIRLTALSRDAFDHALAYAGSSRDGEFVDALFERTRGHPLFFQQLVAQLVRDGALERRGRSWHLAKPLEGPLPLPASVRRSIDARLRCRGPETALVATVLALDSEAEITDVAAICALSEEQALDAIDDLLALAVIDDLLALAVIAESASGPRFVFTHDLIREVAASLASNARRRALHSELASRLETVRLRNVPMRRGRHFAAAGNAEASARAYMDAVLEAFEWDAYHDAIGRCDLALAQVALMPSSGVRECIAAQCKALKGGALANIYRLEEAWEIATQGVHEARRSGDAMILARVLLARGHVGGQMDDGVKQLADADEVLTLAVAGANPRQIGQALYQRTEALATLNRVDDAAAAVNDVVAYAAPLDLWILAAAALNDLIPVQAAQWRFAEAAASIERAFACARKTGRNMEASTLTVAAMTAYLRDDFATVDAQLERTLALLDELAAFPEAGDIKGFGEPDMRFTVHYLRGMRLRAAGRPADALVCVRALAQFGYFLDEPLHGNAYRFLAIDVACDLGDAESLAGVAANLSAILPGSRQMKFGLSGCFALSRARVAVASRDPDAATAVGNAFLEVERNAAAAPLDCIRALRDVERAAKACAAGDVTEKAAALAQTYERRHAAAIAPTQGAIATP